MSKLKEVVKILTDAVPAFATVSKGGPDSLPHAALKTNIFKESTDVSEAKAREFYKLHFNEVGKMEDKYAFKQLSETFLVNGIESHIFEAIDLEKNNFNSQKIMIFVHGINNTHWNALETFKYWADKGYRVFAYDQRGSGENYENSNFTFGFHEGEDLFGLYQTLVEVLNPKEIIIYGQSNGASTLFSFATRFYNQIDFSKMCLIAEAGYTSPQNLLEGIFKDKGVPSAMIMPLSIITYQRFTSENINTAFNCLDNINNVSAPLMIIHSKDDRIVNWQMSKDLFEKRKNGLYADQTSFYLKDDFRHLGISRDSWINKNGEAPKLFEEIFSFINKNLYNN